MEHLVAVMLLVGCGADGTVCTEVPVPAPVYSSVEECRSELEMQMRFSTGTDRLFGACEVVDEALLEQSATIEWAVSRGGALLVDIRPDPAPALAANPPASTVANTSATPS